MIGAGIGITPLRALLERTPFAPGQATVLLRGHSDHELYLSGEILELCRRRGATQFHLTGARDPGAPDSWPDADVYVCGPAGWATNVLSAARSAGVREDQLHYERFDW
jgi:ferredoxin-NADP reductase